MKLRSAGHRVSSVEFDRYQTRVFSLNPLCVFVVTLAVLLLEGIARAQVGQYPLLDAAANKVIQKYQNSSCEQLRQEKGQPRSEMQNRMVNFLRSDPQMRQAFIDRVAAPVANKLFECGMIP